LPKEAAAELNSFRRSRSKSFEGALKLSGEGHLDRSKQSIHAELERIDSLRSQEHLQNVEAAGINMEGGISSNESGNNHPLQVEEEDDDSMLHHIYNVQGIIEELPGGDVPVATE
jgi:hypothetical protein